MGHRNHDGSTYVLSQQVWLKLACIGVCCRILGSEIAARLPITSMTVANNMETLMLNHRNSTETPPHINVPS